MHYDWRPEQARKSLNRILPEVEGKFADKLAGNPGDWQMFKFRLDSQWERLFTYLHSLYGWQYDFFYTLQRLFHTMVEYWLLRPKELRRLDKKRLAEPDWFLSEEVV